MAQQQNLVYQDASPLLQRGEIGEEETIYNMSQKLNQAYNEGVYDLTNSIVDGVNKLNEIEFKNNMQEQLFKAYSDNSTNPKKFQEASKSIVDGLVKNLPYNQKDAYREVFNQAAQKYYLKTCANQDRVQNDQIKEQTIINNQNLVNETSLAIDSIVNSNKAEQATGLEDLSTLALNFYNNLHATDGNGMPIFSAQDRVKQFDTFKGNIFGEFASKKLNALPTLQDKIKFMQNLQSGKETLSFKFPNTEKDTVISGKGLSTGQINSINKQLELQLKQNLEQQKLIENENYLNDIEQGRILPDPKSKDYRKRIDQKYISDFDLRNVDVTNPAERQKAENEIGLFVSTYKTVPEKLVSDLRSFMATNSPDHMALGAGIIDNISTNSPEMMQFLPNNDFSKAFTMNNLIKAGLPAEEAFKSIESQFRTSPEIRKERLKQLTIDVNTEGLDFSIESIRSGSLWWKDNLPVDVNESIEFTQQLKSLVQSEYLNGADAKTAYKTALGIMSKRWGATKINGSSQLTALPPEKYYSALEQGLTPKWMREQAVLYAKEFSGNKDIPDDEIVIVPDSITYAQAGNETSKPSYSLNRLTERGIEPITDTEGNFARVGSNIWDGENAYKQVLLHEHMKGTKLKMLGGIPAINEDIQESMTVEEQEEIIKQQSKITQEAFKYKEGSEKEFLKKIREKQKGIDKRNEIIKRANRMGLGYITNFKR